MDTEETIRIHQYQIISRDARSALCEKMEDASEKEKLKMKQAIRINDRVFHQANELWFMLHYPCYLYRCAKENNDIKQEKSYRRHMESQDRKIVSAMSKIFVARERIKENPYIHLFDPLYDCINDILINKRSQYFA